MEKSREVIIQMPYIPDLSVNHYLGRTKPDNTNKIRYYVKPHVKVWVEELGWKVKISPLEDWRLPLSVTCSGVFKDKRSTPDLSNLSKCTLDAIEETTGINDQNMRWHDGVITIVKDVSPYLILTIKEAKDESRRHGDESTANSGCAG